LTYFFREVHHFEYISKIILPQYHAANPHGCFKVYSAGCSSGEEVLSCAITLERFKKSYPGFKYEIVGADIDQKMVDFATRGIYSESSLLHVSDEDKRLIFDKGTEDNKGFFKVKRSIRANLNFFRQSILERVSEGDTFEVIFCRNVLIYFDEVSQVSALRVFSTQISKNGTLFLGHSESMVGKQSHFSLTTKTMYKAIK